VTRCLTECKALLSSDRKLSDAAISLVEDLDGSKAGILGLCEVRIESDRLYGRTSDRFVFAAVLGLL